MISQNEDRLARLDETGSQLPTISMGLSHKDAAPENAPGEAVVPEVTRPQTLAITSSPQYLVSSFYQFVELSPSQVETLYERLNNWAEDLRINGLVIIGPEGLNASLAGLPQPIRSFESHLNLRLTDLGFAGFWFKHSVAARSPFRNFKIKRRNEIVTLKRPDIRPKTNTYRHLSPQAWHEAITHPNALIVDTRNDYEVEIGKFKNAINPSINEFDEFMESIEKAKLPKQQPMYIYCTGGIRCEKAIYALEEAGYTDVYQLEGGILNYLKEYGPSGHFEGECFVFDYRVAVDTELKPTERYRLCPHCGQPGDQLIACGFCKTEDLVCAKCLRLGPRYHSCSKNCAYHIELGHKFKQPHRDGRKKREPLPMSPPASSDLTSPAASDSVRPR